MKRSTASASAFPCRKLLVSAVGAACALPATALAQVPAELQIYGRANVSYERITVDGAGTSETNWEAVDNSSRIGVRGKRDLGGGMSGFFQVESRVTLDDGGTVDTDTGKGGSTFSSRDSWIGLQGAFGTARVGRTIGPVYYATYDYISNHNHDTGTSSDALLAPTIFGNQGFMNNTVWYSSPKMGAFSVDAAFSRLGEDRVVAGQSQPSHLGIVGAYDQGPWHVAVSHAETKNSFNLDGVTPNIKDQATTVGGLYNFGGRYIVGALIESAKSQLPAGNAKRNYFRGSLMIPVAKHEFHVNVGVADDRLDALNTADAGAKQWTLGYNYNIDKQFKVYAFYTVVDNEDNGTYSTGLPGVDLKSFAVGARYNF